MQPIARPALLRAHTQLSSRGGDGLLYPILLDLHGRRLRRLDLVRLGSGDGLHECLARDLWAVGPQPLRFGERKGVVGA